MYSLVHALQQSLSLCRALRFRLTASLASLQRCCPLFPLHSGSCLPGIFSMRLECVCVCVCVRVCVCVSVPTLFHLCCLSLPPGPPSLTLSHSCERYTIVSTPQRLVARARRRALDHVDSAPIGSLTAAFRSFEWRVPHVSFDVYCLVNQTLFPLVLTLLTVVVLFFTLPLFN